MSAIRRVSNLGTQGVSTIVDGTITQADLNTNIPLSGMRNLIINGCMRVNQRNTAITSGVGYTVDRWYVNTGGTANTSTAQNADAPSGSGLSASLRVTGSGSVGSGMRWLGQRIEATNCDGLAYGSSSAKAITISFWVRATTPGTYTVSLLNSTRVYAASYSISSSNTWEYKTITIAGDTSLAISTMLDVRFIWYGSSETWITPNVWGTNTGFGAATNQVAAFGSGSIFAITGVQVEIATQATPFEQRPIGLELSLCQRYYWRSGTVWQYFVANNANQFGEGFIFKLPVTMRATPTLTNNFVSNDNALLQNTAATTEVVMLRETCNAPQFPYSSFTYSFTVEIEL